MYCIPPLNLVDDNNRAKGLAGTAGVGGGVKNQTGVAFVPSDMGRQ